jgi:hypothetical protein
MSAPAPPPAAVRYSLRCGSHNGRTFLGGGMRTVGPLEIVNTTGAIVLKLPAGGFEQSANSASRQQPQGKSGGKAGRAEKAGFELGWVPMDRGVVVVLQLLAAPAGGADGHNQVRLQSVGVPWRN